MRRPCRRSLSRNLSRLVAARTLHHRLPRPSNDRLSGNRRDDSDRGHFLRWQELGKEPQTHSTGTLALSITDETLQPKPTPPAHVRRWPSEYPPASHLPQVSAHYPARTARTHNDGSVPWARTARSTRRTTPESSASA